MNENKINKNEIIDKYRDVIIKSTEIQINNIKGYLQALDNKEKIESYQKSIDKYTSLLEKVKNKEELTLYEINLTSILLSNSSVSMSQTAKKLADSALQISKIVKALTS